MSDVIVRGLLNAIDVRFVACRLSGAADEACRRHELEGGPARYLSEALVGCALMGSILQRSEKLTLQIRGEGPLRSLMADIDELGNVRGTLSIAEGAAYESLVRTPGILVVSRSRPGDLTYQGQCELKMGNLPADLAFHCSLSEQIETFMDVVYREGNGTPLRTGGLLLQALPGADLETFERLRRSFETQERSLALELVDDPGGYASHLLREFEPHVLIEKDLAFACSCSHQRVEAILRALGKDEVESMIQEDHGAEITCHWCGARYLFSEQELLTLLTNFSRN